MSKVFEELISDGIMITIDELERSIFSKNKEKYTSANSNDGGQNKSNPEIVCRSFLLQG